MPAAIFSPCRTWRYTLQRVFVPFPASYSDTEVEEMPYINFVCLNPSTADETHDDPTVRRCINWSKAWGYDRMIVTNLFALRSTRPKVLYDANDPIGPENDHYLLNTARLADKVIAAWGLHGRLHDRAAWFRKEMSGWPLYILREGKNEPWHPLYLPNDTTPILWSKQK